MGFSFGTKAGDAKDSDGIFLRGFPKGETKVRFLQDRTDWFRYREHYIDRQAFPCTQTPSCPGCTHDNEMVRRNPVRYGTFAFFVDRKQVQGVKIGPRLYDRLALREQRNDGTLLNRDYVIIKSGSALETDYDVDQDERYPLDIESLWAQRGEMTCEQIVTHQFEQLWGTPDKYVTDGATNNEPVAPAVEPKADEVPDALLSKAEREQKAAEADLEVSEAELKSMSRSQLCAVWEKAGFEGFDDDWGAPDLVREILKRAS